MQRVVIIGAGAHGHDVAEIIRHRAQNGNGPALLGFVVDSGYATEPGDSRLPILGDWAWFEKTDCADLAVICAVGNPAVRKRFVEKAQSLGLLFINAISPAAHVVPDAKIGKGVMVFPHAVISRNVLLSDHSVVNAGSTLGHDTRLESYATISPGVHLAGNVSIGEGCCMGIGSSVIERVSIGAWTTIGAGAVVVDDLPGNVIAMGVPARVISTKRPT